MAKKTYNNRKNFIDELCSMSDIEINDFIKTNGKPPKMIEMMRPVKENV